MTDRPNARRSTLSSLVAALAAGGCALGPAPLKSPPPADQVIKSSGGIMANNAGRMVGKVKNGPLGLIEGQGASLRLQTAQALIAVAGARVEVTDADGKVVSVGTATTDAEGGFVIRRFQPSASALYVRAEYAVGDQRVVLRAAAAAPRKAGSVDVLVDPAASLVAKKTLAMIRQRELSSSAVDPALLEKAARAVAAELDASTLAIAALGDDSEAARAFDKMLDRSQALEDTLRKLLGAGAMATLLEPTPEDAAGGAGGRPSLSLRPPTANMTREAPGTVLLAGAGSAGFADGPADTARFNVPYDVATDGRGNAYVADSDNHRIRKIAATGEVTTVAGSGEAGFADGPATSAMFNSPNGVAVGPDGALYVADYGNNRIRKITPDGNVTTLAGMTAPGFADGPGAQARFSAPSDLTVDATGTVYVADTDDHRIRKITPDGQVSTIAGDGVPGLLDGEALRARLSGPSDVAVDSTGKLFIADTGNHAVRVLRDGRLQTLAGNGSAGFADGQGATARFNVPYGIAVGPGGTLYVADSSNHSVRLVTPAGAVSTFWGQQGGPAADPPKGLFNGPSGVAIRVNAAGVPEVFVADAGLHVIRKFALLTAPKDDGLLLPK